MNISVPSGIAFVLNSGLLGNALLVPAIIIATTVHEFTRALVSTLLGDPTPKNNGRLTLNPIKHFEPIGFLLMYASALSSFLGCGWGKPVDTQPRHYHDRKTGAILTAVLPSVANLLIAIISSYALKYFSINAVLVIFFAALQWMNLSIAVFNLLPVVPFDCLKVVMELVSRKNYFSLTQVESVAQMIMMILLFVDLLTVVLMPVYRGLLFVVNLLTF